MKCSLHARPFSSPNELYSVLQMFPGLREPYLGERHHFTLMRYTFLTPSSAYSSYNHHPIAPHHGQTTVPGYILNMLRPTFDPPQTTLGCPPSYIPQCATHPAMHLEHIPLLPLLFGSLSSRSAVAHVQFAFHKTQETRVCKNVSSKNKGKCRDGAVCL